MWHVYYKSHIISIWMTKMRKNIYIEQGKQTLLLKKKYSTLMTYVLTKIRLHVSANLRRKVMERTVK